MDMAGNPEYTVRVLAPLGRDAELACSALHDHHALLAHRRQVAVQAIDDNEARSILLHRIHDALDELPGRQLRGIELLDLDQA